MTNQRNYTAYFENARLASRKAVPNSALINMVLNDLAETAIAQTDRILAENQKDLAQMDVSNPNYDRLKLTKDRIADIANDIINVTKLENPIGQIHSEKTMPNGLHISKVTVPLGVVGVIYEARPNVTFDVFALCFKTGNVCILKGGKDAVYSNIAIVAIIHKVLAKHHIDQERVILLPPEREAAEAMFKAIGYLDVLIPRGSQGLINNVRQNSRVPVIETGAGVVHIYFDEFADLKKGAGIICNAKTRRVSVCNALDCLLINAARLNDLPEIVSAMGEAGVEVFADEPAYFILKDCYPVNLLHHATDEHFGREFLSLKLAIKTVADLEQALDHIAAHSSKHSEAIISENTVNVDAFLSLIDAAVVYVNASTAFTDGAQFGLGAEIGISTQKLHARGPMGLDALTSYKWIVKGNGQIRQ